MSTEAILTSGLAREVVQLRISMDVDYATAAGKNIRS